MSSKTPSKRDHRIHVVLDWDGTLTKNDSLHLVSDIGYRLNDGAEPPLTPWADIVKAYLDDFKAHASAYQPRKEFRRAVAEESAWLASLEAVENHSIRRVETAGLFKGVREPDIRAAAADAIRSRNLQLREGWSDLIQYDHDNACDVFILSVNWSALFIKSCLEKKITEEQVTGSPQVSRLKKMRNIHIKANEIQGIERSEGSSGLLSLSADAGIRTSEDKLSALRELLLGDRANLGTKENLDTSHDGKNHEANDGKALLLYVGDSATDFDSLLYADIGICIQDDPKGSGQEELAEIFARVGVAVEPLVNLQSLRGNSDKKRIIWSAVNLNEIAALISRIENA